MHLFLAGQFQLYFTQYTNTYIYFIYTTFYIFICYKYSARSDVSMSVSCSETRLDDWRFVIVAICVFPPHFRIVLAMFAYRLHKSFYFDVPMMTPITFVMIKKLITTIKNEILPAFILHNLNWKFFLQIFCKMHNKFGAQSVRMWVFTQSVRSRSHPAYKKRTDLFNKLPGALLVNSESLYKVTSHWPQSKIFFLNSNLIPSGTLFIATTNSFSFTFYQRKMNSFNDTIY